MLTPPRRTAVAATTVALLITLATGCATAVEPTPSPTATGFATEEEAFAAAEATYRAYVDAGNRERAGEDSDTLPSEYLMGEALAAEHESISTFAGAGVRLEGDITVASIQRLSSDRWSATIGVCIDTTATRVVDLQGADVTPKDRLDLLALDITAGWTSTGVFVSSTTASDFVC